MARVILPDGKFRSREIAPGVLLASFYPGGKDGPDGAVLRPEPGGQTWSEMVMIGGPDDAFHMSLPDIRMPANQCWPLHWHDCWTAVILIEGQCLIGDWWMGPGDVFVTLPSLEYGPLVSGPEGCRLFEIFAQGHRSPGGYAPEFHDHPTLEGTGAVFAERSELNKRNEGRQMLPCDGTEGIWKGRLGSGATWNFGDLSDPERGVMADTRLLANQALPAHRRADWHAMLVMDGEIEVGGVALGQDDYILARPNSPIPQVTAGASGAQLLELSRTAAGAAPIMATAG